MSEVAKLFMNKKNEIHWYAIYTKPRWEKKVDERLLLKNIKSWCPLQKVQRQWTDRKKIIEDPIFKSYVFVQINLQQRLNVLDTEGVINFVHYDGNPAIIRDQEIETIRSFLELGNARISIQSIESFEADMKVKINHGIFMDNTGTVIRASNKKVIVKLESLGQIMVVEFPNNFVGKI